MAKTPTINKLSIIGMKGSTFTVLSEWLSYTHKVKNDYINTVPKGSVKYYVDYRKETCTCEHYLHRHSTPNFQPCKHVMFAKKVVLESKVKNLVHAKLANQGLSLEYIIKMTATPNGMIAVSYRINSGVGCMFINPNKLPEVGYFKHQKRKIEGSINPLIDIYDNDGNQVSIVRILEGADPSGFQRLELNDPPRSKEKVSNFGFDFYDVAIKFSCHKVNSAYHPIPSLQDSQSKPSTVSPEIIFESDADVQKFRKNYTVFKSVKF